MAIYDYLGNTVIASLEPADTDIPVVSITGELYETKAEGESNVIIDYKSSTLHFTDYATAKVQGDSSQWYPKRNYTIKLFSNAQRTSKDKRQFKDWDKKRNKFVLKANWIDHSHARNIVNARIWSQVMKARPDYEQLPSPLRKGNLAIDGFPVRVYHNGVYMGLYTWNLPKDSLYGVDSDNDNHCIMQSDGLPNEGDLSMYFKRSGLGDRWSDELHDTMPAIINTSWTAVVTFVNESTDAQFKSNIGSYVDLLSLIDVHIYIQLLTLMDQIGKNQTFYTYDAEHWYHGMYDMDGSWGLKAWNPATGFVSHEFVFQNNYTGYGYSGGNRLHDKLTANFLPEITARYTELRSSVLTADNIISEFDKFMTPIPPYIYAEDYAATTGNGEFTEMPIVTDNHLLQLRDYIPKRLAYIDANLK